MNTSSCARLLAFSLLPVSLALFGCGGAISLPDTHLTSQVSGPAIKGSAFGGHAPIVGMHIYLLQPGTSAYGSTATSILGNNGATTSTDGTGFTLATDPATNGDPNATPGSSYVTTDSMGAYDLTGLYSCVAGQPVYIYGYGGSSTGYAGEDPITKIVVTGEGGKDGDYTATYTVTVSTAVTLTAGQQVPISGLAGTTTDYYFTDLNATQTVTDAVTNSTTFEFSATTAKEIEDDTYTTTSKESFGANGVATVPGFTTAANPIVELATLGNCPDNLTNTTGNFSGGSTAINYIYMNEVSTVATAYTFQPFTVAATSGTANNSAWDIGTPGGSALAGIENAANTAGQLYDIQGRGDTSSATGEGEGHVANLTTPLVLGGAPGGGNGTAPQTTVDTLANILAACIDSAAGTDDSLSAACTTLFDTATNNGEASGSADTYTPTDTATAAINIARYPAGYDAGDSTTYVTALYDLPGSVVPYAPALTALPSSFQLVIGYANPATIPGGGAGLGETNGKSPHAIAVDTLGNIYTVNTSGNALNILTPLGALATSVGTSTLSGPVSVALNYDSTTGEAADVWVANDVSGELSEFTATTTTTTTTAGVTTTTTTVGGSSGTSVTPATGKLLEDAEFDGSGNIWATTSSPSLVELSATGAVEHTSAATDLTAPIGVALESGTAGDVWVADSTADDATEFTNATDTAVDKYAGNNADVEDPNGVAIDAGGNVWLTDYDGYVSKLTSAGAAETGSPFEAGGLTTEPLDGIAIDGGGNVWVASPKDTNTTGTLHKYSNAGVQISPADGYSLVVGSADALAIDGSGNIWCSSAALPDVYEVVGAALPVVTPLSLAVQSSRLGSEPTKTVP